MLNQQVQSFWEPKHVHELELKVIKRVNTVNVTGKHEMNTQVKIVNESDNQYKMSVNNDDVIGGSVPSVPVNPTPECYLTFWDEQY